jgi:hypothetical protein
LEPYLKGQKLQEPPSDDCSQLKWPNLGNSVKTDQASFCLWLFLHLSRLYGYSENGLYMDSLRVSTILTYYFISQKTIIKIVICHKKLMQFIAVSDRSNSKSFTILVTFLPPLQFVLFLSTPICCHGSNKYT